jgi:hypothetical protein
MPCNCTLGAFMTMALLRPIATICTVAVVFAGAAYALTLSPSSGDSRLVAQAPVDQTAPEMQALQAAIDSKDTTAIFNLLNQSPRDFASGGLTGAQQNIAIAVIRNAPSGLAIVANLLSNSPTGGFRFSNVTTLALVNLVVAENQNQTQASPH